MKQSAHGAYGADDDIVDYILGITYEIWEERGLELIHQYYSDDCVVYGLDGITHGAGEVVDGTRATLESFPDRNLLAESVIWDGDTRNGYTSHRLSSRATNRAPTIFGPATGGPIRMTNIADCVIDEGVIVKEWLVRDNLVLARQVGADPIAAARDMAARRSDELATWIAEEHLRLRSADTLERVCDSPRDDPEAFAWNAIASCWRGDHAEFESVFAPYAAMHRSPYTHYSGRDAIFDYYQNLRRIMGQVRFSVDHVAAQPVAVNGVDIAVRWTVSGSHTGDMGEIEPTGKPLFLLGVTHWHCAAGRIISEHTVFDDLAFLSQAFAE